MFAVDRQHILKLLHAQININGHIVGAAVGSGMTAKYTVMGGADLLLALSAGKYRIMGRSSHASYLCYGSNNDIVMDMGVHELLPIIKDVPILFGLFSTDPEIHLYEYLKEIRENGFSGIVNFPTMGLIDGKFRQALEEEGNGFGKEVEAIKLARYLDLFTLAFVTNEEETKQMLEAGADVICLHLGLTKGGILGAKKYISIEEAKRMAVRIFQMCREIQPDTIRMIYAGPANTPIDMQYLYKNTGCQGYIGGSTFERIPAERAILNTTRAFKSGGSFDRNNVMSKIVDGGWNPKDYAEFVKQYVAEHYMDEIQLENLALVAHISLSYLSIRFKKEVGMSFSEYLVRYRVGRAKEQLRTSTDSCRQIAENVGYRDYVQFSKMFKKYEGISPTEYRRSANA